MYRHLAPEYRIEQLKGKTISTEIRPCVHDFSDLPGSSRSCELWFGKTHRNRSMCLKELLWSPALSLSVIEAKDFH